MLTFPLALAEFFDLLPREGHDFSLPLDGAVDVTNGGTGILAQRRDLLWMGSFATPRLAGRNAQRVVARARMLEASGAAFLVTDRAFPGPAADPDGTVIAPYAGLSKIASITDNRRGCGLTGLAPNYALEIGDRFSVSYLSDPVRYSVHEVISDVAATGAGVIAAEGVEVWPPFPRGVAVDDPVAFYRPVISARIVPGSLTAPRHGVGPASPMSFKWDEVKV